MADEHDPLPSSAAAERWLAKADDDLAVAQLISRSPAVPSWASGLLRRLEPLPGDITPVSLFEPSDIADEPPTIGRCKVLEG